MNKLNKYPQPQLEIMEIRIHKFGKILGTKYRASITYKCPRWGYRTVCGCARNTIREAIKNTDGQARDNR